MSGLDIELSPKRMWTGNGRPEASSSRTLAGTAREPAAGLARLPFLRFDSRGSRRRLQNALFCQRAVEEVEPILTPEELAAEHVRRRAEHAALDRLLREHVVALRDVGGVGALVECRGVVPERG